MCRKLIVVLSLQDLDVPELTESLTKTLVTSNAPVKSCASSAAAATTGSESNDSLQEIDQADLAALLPDVQNANAPEHEQFSFNGSDDHHNYIMEEDIMAAFMGDMENGSNTKQQLDTSGSVDSTEEDDDDDDEDDDDDDSPSASADCSTSELEEDAAQLVSPPDHVDSEPMVSSSDDVHKQQQNSSKSRPSNQRPSSSSERISHQVAGASSSTTTHKTKRKRGRPPKMQSVCVQTTQTCAPGVALPLPESMLLRIDPSVSPDSGIQSIAGSPVTHDSPSPSSTTTTTMVVPSTAQITDESTISANKTIAAGQSLMSAKTKSVMPPAEESVACSVNSVTFKKPERTMEQKNIQLKRPLSSSSSVTKKSKKQSEETSMKKRRGRPSSKISGVASVKTSRPKPSVTSETVSVTSSVVSETISCNTSFDPVPGLNADSSAPGVGSKSSLLLASRLDLSKPKRGRPKGSGRKHSRNLLHKLSTIGRVTSTSPTEECVIETSKPAAPLVHPKLGHDLAGSVKSSFGKHCHYLESDISVESCESGQNTSERLQGSIETATSKHSLSVSSVSFPFKRKRGRPRKNPMPTLSSKSTSSSFSSLYRKVSKSGSFSTFSSLNTCTSPNTSPKTSHTSVLNRKRENETIEPQNQELNTSKESCDISDIDLANSSPLQQLCGSARNDSSPGSSEKKNVAKKPKKPKLHVMMRVTKRRRRHRKKTSTSTSDGAKSDSAVEKSPVKEEEKGNVQGCIECSVSSPEKLEVQKSPIAFTDTKDVIKSLPRRKVFDNDSEKVRPTESQEDEKPINPPLTVNKRRAFSPKRMETFMKVPTPSSESESETIKSLQQSDRLFLKPTNAPELSPCQSPTSSQMLPPAKASPNLDSKVTKTSSKKSKRKKHLKHVKSKHKNIIDPVFISDLNGLTTDLECLTIGDQQLSQINNVIQTNPLATIFKISRSLLRRKKRKDKTADVSFIKHKTSKEAITSSTSGENSKQKHSILASPSLTKVKHKTFGSLKAAAKNQNKEEQHKKEKSSMSLPRSSEKEKAKRGRKKKVSSVSSVVADTKSQKVIDNNEQCLPLKKRHKLISAAAEEKDELKEATTNDVVDKTPTLPVGSADTNVSSPKVEKRKVGRPRKISVCETNSGKHFFSVSMFICFWGGSFIQGCYFE